MENRHHWAMETNRVAVCGRGSKQARFAATLVQLLGIECEPTSHGQECARAAVVIDTQGLHVGERGVLPVGVGGLRLPGDEAEFLRAVDRLLHPEAAALLGVFGKAGGVGASTMVMAIARVAARKRPVAILDCADPPSLFGRLAGGQEAGCGGSETSYREGQSYREGCEGREGREGYCGSELAELAGCRQWRTITVAKSAPDRLGHALALARKIGPGGLVVVDAGRAGSRGSAKLRALCARAIVVGCGRFHRVRGGEKFWPGPLLTLRIRALIRGCCGK